MPATKQHVCTIMDIFLIQGDTCYLEEVPFRGAPCSDGAGSQVDYGSIVENYQPLAIGSIKYDKIAQSPFFNFRVSVL